MAYSTAEARQQLLDDIAAAVEEIGVALAALTEAYDHLDERMADRMEEEVFRPLQVAHGPPAPPPLGVGRAGRPPHPRLRADRLRPPARELPRAARHRRRGDRRVRPPP